MIISEEYNQLNSDLTLRIYSNKGFLLQKDDQLFREALIKNIEEINNYIETNIPIPTPIANNNFICNELIPINNSITEEQILAAKPYLQQALNQLQDKDAYYVRFLYDLLDINKLYQIGEHFQYNNILYTTIQSGLGQKMFENDSESYFIKSELPDDIVEEWQPSNEYKKNERVKYGIHIYKSLFNNNIWSPVDFPAAWQLEESQE